jgi:retron-type reverse transcriptase
VKIGDAMSIVLELVSGVPQGGILSPIIFTLYTADMEMWLKSSSLFNFADDTTTDNKSKCKKAIKDRLEEDAVNILNFMASNGLVANKTKTEFLVLNEKKTR